MKTPYLPKKCVSAIEKRRLQISFAIVFFGAPKMIRTSDTRFRKPLLYPLSYKGIYVLFGRIPAGGNDLFYYTIIIFVFQLQSKQKVNKRSEG